jgi:methyl-CpG-binding domain-containing protein 9
VLSLVQKFATHPISSNHNKNLENELLEALAVLNDLPKAPWDDGLCKVCGVDRDDKSVLLCDTCDSEYHMYCLTPPLTRIPEGNWYCPSCCRSKGKERQDSGSAEKGGLKGSGSEEKRTFKLALSQLVSTMEQREYWEMSVDEAVFYNYIHFNIIYVFKRICVKYAEILKKWVYACILCPSKNRKKK